MNCSKYLFAGQRTVYFLSQHAFTDSKCSHPFTLRTFTVWMKTRLLKNICPLFRFIKMATSKTFQIKAKESSDGCEGKVVLVGNWNGFLMEIASTCEAWHPPYLMESWSFIFQSGTNGRATYQAYLGFPHTHNNHKVIKSKLPIWNVFLFLSVFIKRVMAGGLEWVDRRQTYSIHNHHGWLCGKQKQVLASWETPA